MGKQREKKKKNYFLTPPLRQNGKKNLTLVCLVSWKFFARWGEKEELTLKVLQKY